MIFNQHAFISYAQLDNQPLTPDQRGWISQFHATLETMLAQQLGEKVRIWRDSKLSGTDVFADEIVQQFPHTALLISVLSPRYLRSDWCKRELAAFCEAAEHTGGITVGNKSRIVKVVKTPLGDGMSLPVQVQNALGFDFFTYDPDKHDPQELDPAFGDRARQQFLLKLKTMAFDLAACLKQLDQAAPNVSGDAPRPARPTVFLADCGRDLREAREQLATELQMHGYEVLPSQPLPLAEDELSPALDGMLERCALSLHMVGASVGLIPDSQSGESLAMLQNRRAVEHCRRGGLRRIIWLPEAVTGARPEQQAFIDGLQRDSALQFGADLLRGNIQDLKGEVFLTLRQLETPAAAAASAATAVAPTFQPRQQRVVHVLMSEADRPAAVPLIKLLRAKGLDVTIPVFVGDAALLRTANADLQTQCDALILFYGSGDEVWKFHKQGELRKRAVAGFGRPPPQLWTLLAPPTTEDKEMLKMLDEPLLIDGRKAISDALLTPMLTALAAPGN